MISRLSLLLIWCITSINGPDVNDMNELLYEGILLLLQGQSPYGQNYTLSVSGNVINQAYFSYPPLALLFHLPAILLTPSAFHTIGAADFMLSFTILHLACDAIVYKAVKDAGSTRGALLMWVIPFWIFMDIMTFLSVPIMFIVLGLARLDYPKEALLWFSVATLIYQYAGIFLLFFLFYKWKDLSKIQIGFIPVIVVFLFFFFLDPVGITNDLIFQQLNRGYESWLVNRYNSPIFFIGSIPSIIYNTSGLQVGTITNFAVSAFILLLLIDITRFEGKRPGLFIFYSGIGLLAVLMSTLHGNLHLYLILVPLPFLANLQGDTLYHAPENLKRSFFTPLLKRIKKGMIRIQQSSWFPSADTIMGLTIRTITIVAFLFFALNSPNFPDLNDQNQKVLMGIQNMIQGINPFGQNYTLSAVGDQPRIWFNEAFYHYTPGSLIFHLPVLIYPVYWSGLGFLDFMPAMFLLHMFCDYVSYRALKRKGLTLAGKILWMLPFWVFIDFVLFISVPIMFMILGLTQLDDPLRSTLFLGCSAVTYHFTAPVLIFAILKHMFVDKKIIKVLLGLLPTIGILAFFQGWCMIQGTPTLMIDDLFFSQTTRVYIPWGDKILDWIAWTGSVPAIAFNISQILGFASEPLDLFTNGVFRLSDLMMLVTAIVSVINVIRYLRNPSRKRLLYYSGISLVLLAASTPHGLLHYWLFALAPFLYYNEVQKNPTL
ncbi:MAG: hypothetical protein ACXACA_06550 [Candidatus Ranarchaeia archaeon]